MRLVVDTNILFAGIMRDGTSRGLLIDSPLQLLAPRAGADRNPTQHGHDRIKI